MALNSLTKKLMDEEEGDSSVDSTDDDSASTTIPDSNSVSSLISRLTSPATSPIFSRPMKPRGRRTPVWRRPCCWVALGVNVALVALALVALEQFGDVIVPVTRVIRTWRFDGTPLPPGYCSEPAADARPPAPGAPAAEFAAWAAGLVKQLTSEERHRLINGAGYRGLDGFMEDGYYVGNLLAVPRLGIPSIRMQDAAQGWRTTDRRMIGQVTAWPCGLAIAASWDPNATFEWSRAIGTEFRAKGANVLLGPAVNVHRVAANGRNAEYISGEDPALGAGLVPSYVRGVQEGAGLVAVAKHFVLNQQETARMEVDSQADERTRWEQYYPPFEAAVDAGVAAIMCSYNVVNGRHACANSETLTTDLKGRMGFSGWVMSDWWALASDRGAAAGTDQDMPGNDGFMSDSVLAELPRSRLDDMAQRVLVGMARTGAWSATPGCRVGCDCSPLLYGANATSSEHVTLARTLAASSAVLLKNGPRHPPQQSQAVDSKASGSKTLPLRSGERVAVLGSACAWSPTGEAGFENFMAGNYYVVGGSGRVLSPHTVSILEGLSGRGLQVKASTSDEFRAAEAALEGADVAVICGGVGSTEGVDRSTLRLDNENFINEAVRLSNAHNIPAVVVAMVSGAIVAPWRHGAAAVLSVFLSGQETGNAVADVLLGDITPSGKLPVTFPEKDEDALWPCPTSFWPFSETPCPYKERLNGGWHVYAGKPVAYPFGHGLSYTAFEYSVAQDWTMVEGGARRAVVRVKNVGQMGGADVVQLYIRYPPTEADEPEMVLRGFQKTPPLQPGAEHDVTFSLGARDLSVWDAAQHSWRQPAGRFEAFVGASSRDLRLCGAFGGQEVEVMRPC